MYGLVNKAVEDLVISTKGESTWKVVKQRAGIIDPVFISMQNYDDKVTYDLVAAASSELNIQAEDILRSFGRHWILYTAREGYGDLLDFSGNSLIEFIENLDNMHARIAVSMPDLNPPSFDHRETSSGDLEVHYYSDRPGLGHMVVGLLEGLIEKFNETAQVEYVQTKHALGYETFTIKFGAQ